MMNRRTIYIVIAAVITLAFSCEPDQVITAEFEDAESMSIYNYIEENDSLYGHFLQILDTSGVGMIISAYNPYGAGYTLFLPTNEAMEEFVASSSTYASMDQLLGDTEYARILAKYHVVNLGIDANDFPFGALPAYTLTEDLLTVNFVLGEDSAYYNINNQAPVISTNHELSNGFVHVISKVLSPITYTSYDWIAADPAYSIFTEAAEATGFDQVLNLNLKEDSSATAITLLVEPDTVYNKKGIYTFQDLVDTLQITNQDYASPDNKLYQYVGYHILAANVFLDDFLDIATNFTTYSNFPVNVNGRGLDIIINRGKQVFDTIINGSDTTIIDFIGFNYDASNVITQSGAIHIIDRVMMLQKPSRATVTFEFYEEPLFSEFRKEPGEYTVDNPDALRVITWTGPKLVFVESADEEHRAWGKDYLLLNGDFSITYQLPKIVQGAYTVYLRTHAYNERNALVELFIDGKKVGGLIDLSTGGSESWPYADVEVGTIDFNNYESHVVEIRALIPGRLEWDYVRFVPVTN
ncbi:MAG: fasciclin domain-containing protein [Bacteroidales bacterium]|nr:fasciclin domain-containing protein [Bacteroidales bacterium]